jgi:hypothetical protein
MCCVIMAEYSSISAGASSAGMSTAVRITEQFRSLATKQARQSRSSVMPGRRYFRSACTFMSAVARDASTAKTRNVRLA